MSHDTLQPMAKQEKPWPCRVLFLSHQRIVQVSPLSSPGSCPGQAEPLESEDREGREGRGRTKGFGTRAGRRATRRAGRRGSRRGRLNLTFKKKEKRRKAHIVGLDSRN